MGELLPFYLAVDQWGNVHKLGRTRHPRKALMEKLGRKRAAKMYRDTPNGPPVHTGYIVAGHWCELYTRDERPV